MVGLPGRVLASLLPLVRSEFIFILRDRTSPVAQVKGACKLLEPLTYRSFPSESGRLATSPSYMSQRLNPFGYMGKCPEIPLVN